MRLLLIKILVFSELASVYVEFDKMIVDSEFCPKKDAAVRVRPAASRTPGGVAAARCALAQRCFNKGLKGVRPAAPAVQHPTPTKTKRFR